MKIDFTKILCNLSGVPLSSVDEQGKPEALSLGHVVLTAILGTYPDEQNLPGAEKFARYELAKKVMNEESQLTTEDIAKIKMLVGKCCTPLVVGAAFDLIEGKAVTDPKIMPFRKKAYGLASGKSKAKPETEAEATPESAAPQAPSAPIESDL
jgi:hypothetical protein